MSCPLRYGNLETPSSTYLIRRFLKHRWLFERYQSSDSLSYILTIEFRGAMEERAPPAESAVRNWSCKRKLNYEIRMYGPC